MNPVRIKGWSVLYYLLREMSEQTMVHMAQREQHPPSIKELELLAEVSKLLTANNLDTVMRQVIDLVSRAVGASRTSFILLNDGAINWNYTFIKNNEYPLNNAVELIASVLSDGFAGWVYDNQRGAIIGDVTRDDRWLDSKDDPLNPRSAMCVPFVTNNEVIALVTMEHEDGDFFTATHLQLMEIIANQAAIAMQNAQLFGYLNAQSSQLRSVLEAMSDALIVLTEDGIIEMLNPAAIALLDPTHRGSILGRHISEFVHLDSAFEPIAEILAAGLLEDDKPWRFETRSDVMEADYQAMMSVWEDGAHNARGYVVVMHNVTQLLDLSRFKDEMLRVATHDLRSPLALISGYVNMVKLDTPDEESPVHEYVDIILGVVDRMQTLVDDLLRVERIRANPLELREKTDLSAMVKQVLVNMRPAATVKEMDFDSVLDLKFEPRIQADAVLLRQAMENLINNAIKYTDRGGKITVYAENDDSRFYFMVEDNGVGIPEEHMSRLFESFYRVQSALHKSKGNGLGLSLVKNVVVRHGGDVFVESEFTKGSRFGFWLPLLDEDEDEATLPETE